MAAPKPVQSTPDADARWLNLVRKHVKSLQYGMVQIVVHDSRVTQIERTERLRIESQASTCEICSPPDRWRPTT